MNEFDLKRTLYIEFPAKSSMISIRNTDTMATFVARNDY